MDYRVISIGCLSCHPLWGEQSATRTPHATTTLVRTGDRVILVDPGLPGQALAARLQERAGISPQQVTDVFLTCFRPAHRGGLHAFQQANWWVSEREREEVGRNLVAQFQSTTDEQAQELLRQEIALLRQIQAAPDRLAEGVDLFPLPGYTPGTTGLLLPLPTATVLVAGDAVVTDEHLQQGQVLVGAYDVNQARESFREAVEIADWLILGHDNMVPNPTRQPF